MGIVYRVKEARGGGTCISLWHVGGRGREISIQGHPGQHSKFQDSQGHIDLVSRKNNFVSIASQTPAPLRPAYIVCDKYNSQEKLSLVK